MQPTDGKDKQEEQDEASNGQEGCCRCQQHFSDLAQALQQQHKLYDPGIPDSLPGSAQATQLLGTRQFARFRRGNIIPVIQAIYQALQISAFLGTCI